MFRTLLRIAADKALLGFASLVAKLPKNDYLYCYTITNGTTNYLTRILLPRIGGKRVMLHKIWRPDFDRELHNHPWDKSKSFILMGSYLEVRLDVPNFQAFNEIRHIQRVVRETNQLDKEDFHKIIAIDAPLWTLFIAGTRQVDEDGVEWGFLDEMTKKVIPHQNYIEQSGNKKA